MHKSKGSEVNKADLRDGMFWLSAPSICKKPLSLLALARMLGITFEFLVFFFFFFFFFRFGEFVFFRVVIFFSPFFRFF